MKLELARKTVARWAGKILFAIVALSLTCGPAATQDLRVATWNLEHLNDEHGEGCIERSKEDFDTIGRRIEGLDADVIAFQEVENSAAARRVFDPARWNVVVSSRPDTGEGRECWDRTDGRLQQQATGIAVRRGVAYRRGTDLSALAGGNPYLRWGTHIEVGRGRNKLHVLSVHLKSGCWGISQDEQGREACAVLNSQMHMLRDWINARQRKQEKFVIAGDFNRRLAIPGDWGWEVLSPDDRPLELASHGVVSLCDPKFPNFIDHIVLWGPGGTLARPGSFREEPRDGPHPDHCALSVALGDGPSGRIGTHRAVKAWLGAFARESADHVTGSIGRRLEQTPGAHASVRLPALIKADGKPDLWDLFSRSSFRLFSSDRAGGPGWNLWGSGMTGSVSAREHGVQARVRTATMGTDIEYGTTTLGIALSHSNGRGITTVTGPIESEVSSISPYFGLGSRDGIRLWGVFGKGKGSLSFESVEGDPVRTDLAMTLGALGLRLDLEEAYHVNWSSRASAVFTGVKTGAMAGLEPIDSSSGRLRAGVEGSRQYVIAGSGLLTPSINAGIRWDTGDSAQGLAAELGTGLHYGRVDGRLSAEARAKGYVTGGDERGWEIGGQVELRPDVHERGLSLTLAPKLVGMKDEIWVEPTRGWSADSPRSMSRQVTAGMTYGMGLGIGGWTAHPYIDVEWANDNERGIFLGTRWRWGAALSCSLETREVTRRNAGQIHAVIARMQVRW